MALNSLFDRIVYEQAKPHLRAALGHFLAAGRTVGEFVGFVAERTGDGLTPYLHQFETEVTRGLVKLEEMAGYEYVTPEERHRMIAEAAYFHAEQRGFVGGNAEQDWREAEAEVDRMLAERSVLLERGRQSFAAMLTAAEAELARLQGALETWRSQRQRKPEDKSR